MYSRMEELRILYEQRLTRAERILVDIDHKLEFGSFNAAEGYKLAHLYGETRRTRRDCKDILTLLDSIRSASPEDWKKGRPGAAVNAMNDRHYVPRELPELFG